MAMITIIFSAYGLFWVVVQIQVLYRILPLHYIPSFLRYGHAHVLG